MLDVRTSLGDQEVVERQSVRLFKLKRRCRPCPAPHACKHRLCAWIGAPLIPLLVPVRSHGPSSLAPQQFYRLSRYRRKGEFHKR
jgi:hypothetical protein